MSVCTFLASDCPLSPVSPSREYSLHIDIDKGTIDDGGADDNFSLRPFPDADLYCAKPYGVALEWHRYTPGRAARILSYIAEVLNRTDTVELWHIWLGDFSDYASRPRIRTYTAAIDTLVPEDLDRFQKEPIWLANGDPRPTFHRLTIHR